VFTVADLQKARSFYEGLLGLEVSFEYGEPTVLMILDRDDFCLHLVDASVASKTAGEGNAYVFSSEVDLLSVELSAKGVELQSGPESYDYGMREIVIADPDGNRLTFGALIEEQGGETS